MKPNLCNGVCHVQCARVTAHPEIRACHVLPRIAQIPHGHLTRHKGLLYPTHSILQN